MKRNPAIIIITIIFSLAVGCGGGSSDNPDTDPIVYTGATTPAVIEQVNGSAMVLGAFSNGSLGSGVFPGGAPEAQPPATLVLIEALKGAMVDVQFDFLANYDGTEQVRSRTINGTCPDAPGSATYSITVDRTTRTFAGSITFTAFCNLGAILNGQATFTGEFDPDNDEFGNFTLTFTALSATYGDFSQTLNGSIAFNFNPPITTVTMNFDLRDNNTGVIYRVENFVVTVTKQDGYYEYTITGTFYDPDYGSVALTTETSFKINNTDLHPYEGALVVTGANNSAARLTCLSNITYQIEVDLNGDGVYDWSSGVITW